MKLVVDGPKHEALHFGSEQQSIPSKYGLSTDRRRRVFGVAARDLRDSTTHIDFGKSAEEVCRVQNFGVVGGPAEEVNIGS